MRNFKKFPKARGAQGTVLGSTDQDYPVTLYSFSPDGAGISRATQVLDSQGNETGDIADTGLSDRYARVYKAGRP